MNVYSIEVENALGEHPAVLEVAAVGVADARWGEAVTACVVLHTGSRVSADELVAFCRERLAGYKVPKRVEFFECLPRNPMHKVVKPELRARLVPQA